MSHQQDVLLPRVPIFLVDRGWRTRKPKDRPSKGTNLLYGEESRSDSTYKVRESGTR